MATCPYCATELDDEGASCPRCSAGDDRAHLHDHTVPEVPVAVGSPADASAGSPPLPAPASGGSSGYVLGAVGAGVVGAATMLLMLGFPGASSDAPATGEAAPAPAVTETPSASPSLPKWTDTHRDRWVSNHPRSLAFELPAEQRVAVWMDRVRPLLVVRCLAQTMDVFVVTETAAAIEPQDEDHTVHVAFDDGPVETVRWPDSLDHDALFAPDGAAFARRLATARTLRFGFTPHNAAPVNVDFDLAGAERVVAEVTKTCASRRR
jgi:hypothetical protein